MPSIRPIREDADELVVAATHNGPFHADDVVAGALLLSMGPEITFVRTRDPEQIAEADVVFDVGGVHDPSTWRLDHHQFRSTEARVRSRFMPAVPLSSAGMTLEAMVDSGAMSEDVAEIVYRDLVAAIDLHDNGEASPPPMGHPHGATLSGVLSRFNPNWDDENKDFDAAFHRAVMWALESLVLPAIASAESTIRAREIVASAVKPGNPIAVLPVAVPGARDMVLDLDAEVDFLVHPSDFGGWMVMTVPPSREDAFSQRVPLPAEWAGLRGEELNAELAKAGVRTDVLEAGIAANPSSVFTHTGRFCGGHGTKEAAIAMAMAAFYHKVKREARREVLRGPKA